MYIRESKTSNRKTGKVYVKHTLVESVRTPKGPRQRTVMQLGRLSLPRQHWPSLAIELERRPRGPGGVRASRTRPRPVRPEGRRQRHGHLRRATATQGRERK